MSQERLMTVLLGPHLTEKASRAQERNQVMFKVRRDANKAEIKQAVELMFDVKVDKVQVLNQKGKQKRFQLTSGKRSDWKKACVRLAEGSELDFLGAE